MTPKWLAGFKTAERDKSRATLERLASLRCFDVEPVAALVSEVSEDLDALFFRETSANEGRGCIVDCGVDFQIPAPRIWVEGFGPVVEDRLPIVCELDDDGRTYRVFHAPNAMGGPFFMPLATFEVDDGGLVLVEMCDRVAAHRDYVAHVRGTTREHFLQHAGSPGADAIIEQHLSELREDENALLGFADRGNEHLGKSAAFDMADFFAFLAVVSSPHAATEESRRTFAVREKMRKLNLRPVAGEIKHTRVFIRVGERHAAADGLPRTSSPKAYHFCRGHLRHKAGRVERVRAHWRGDPAFGIRLPTYTVH